MKKLLSLLLALVLSVALAVPVMAADTEQEETAAWTLYRLGLFQGTDTDSQGFPVFSLEQAPTRAQGVTMLVRLIGREEEALKGNWTTPFLDVPDWAKPYVGYAYSQGLTTGRSETKFDAEGPLNAAAYLTFVLRALGYTSGTDFAWDSAWTLSDKLGITDGGYGADTTDFDRGDVAWISARALEVKAKGSDKTLRETLAGLGIKDGPEVRCLWQGTCQTCRPGKMVFSFAPVEESKETYTKFVVDKATANGVPCKIISQFNTEKTVTAQCREVSKGLEEDITLPKAFGLVVLEYDETKAEAAATRTIAEGGRVYPVVEYKLNCTGTLKDGKKVEEMAVLRCYIDSYWGPF